jgi:signal peptidase I
MDWALTIALAVGAVLVFQAEVAKPYRVPTASMEPTLHCAKPVRGCLSLVSDRVIANRLVYRFHEPRRGDIIVFEAPAQAEAACSAGGTYIKRIVGLPGERLSMRMDWSWSTASRLQSPICSPATAVARTVTGRVSPTTATSSSATTARCPATHADGASSHGTTSSAGRKLRIGHRTASGSRSDTRSLELVETVEVELGPKRYLAAP